uniref:Uncharacterized protein n=1 Tax=Anguilla anguilla TaxID=7936 RepID=A0A0E9W356_ANGAN
MRKRTVRRRKRPWAPLLNSQHSLSAKTETCKNKYVVLDLSLVYIWNQMCVKLNVWSEMDLTVKRSCHVILQFNGGCAASVLEIYRPVGFHPNHNKGHLIQQLDA